MIMNRFYSRAAEFFHDIGRWCEHKSLLIRLDNGAKVHLMTSHVEWSDAPPPLQFDFSKWIQSEEIREALVRGYTAPKNKCLIPPDSCVSWTTANWNDGNKSNMGEDSE